MEKTNIDSLKSGKSDGFQGGSSIRRNHATKSDQVRKVYLWSFCCASLSCCTKLIIDRGIFDSDKYWQLLFMDLSYSCIIVDLGGSLSHVLLCCYVNIIFCRLLILHWFCESIERLIALNISRHCNLQVFFYHNGLVRDFTVY